MNWWVLALRLTGLGWYVAICIVIGVTGGAGLDRLAGTKVLFLLLGTVLGTVVAFWGLYKMVQPFLSNYGVKREGPNSNGRNS
jgi:F0F1-type ATP synthase assembly protein I